MPCSSFTPYTGDDPGYLLLRIRRWAEQRVPKELWAELNVETDVEPRHVAIVEVRPPWDGRSERQRADCGRSTGETGTLDW